MLEVPRRSYHVRVPKINPEADLFLDESEEISDVEPATVPHTVVRKPTSEEIAFQSDLNAMPHLCRAELQRKSWQTVNVGGVTVVKGGCLDTTSTLVV